MSFKSTKSIEGYYIIDKKNLAFHKVHYNTIFENISEIPYKEKKNVKWKTIANELSVSFKKSRKNNKFYINNAKLKNVVEVIKNNEKTVYEATYEILTTQNFISKSVISNFSSNKNLFKTKFTYNEDFWKNQNQLLLNDKLVKFINSLDKLKNEYDVYSNFSE